MTPALIAGAAALSLVELDAASAFQVMVSRPAVFGPALGAAFGQPALGLGLGALWELISLDAPIGGYLPLNATVSAGACLLLALGPGGAPPELAFPAGLVAGAAHRAVEQWLRKRRAACARECESCLDRGELPPLGRVAAFELAKQAAITFVVLCAVLPLRGPLSSFWPASPELAQAALRLGLQLCPWLGLAALLHALRVREA